MAENSIYLDYNATTPLSLEVKEAMLEVMEKPFIANPSSQHQLGREAKGIIESARECLNASLKGSGGEIVFTSGGTESNHIAILGTLREAQKSHPKPHVISSAIEHPSILTLVETLEDQGRIEVDWIDAQTSGVVAPEAILSRVREDETSLVVLQRVNSETGVIQEVEKLTEKLTSLKIPLLCDMVQSLGKIPSDLNELNVDLATFSAHKIFGPKGIGALYIKKKTPFISPYKGVSQERGRRGGTENVLGIAGFSKAVELATQDLPFSQSTSLRDEFESRLKESPLNVVINGEGARRVGNTSHISFPGIDSEMFLIRLDLNGVYASNGSACASGAQEPSHVLKSMGLDDTLLRSAVRFSLGRFTTTDDLNRVIELVIRTGGELM